MTPEQKTLAKQILTNSKKVRAIAKNLSPKPKPGVPVPMNMDSIGSLYRTAASEAKRSAKFLLRGLVDGHGDVEYTGTPAKAIVTLGTASDFLHVAMDFEAQARTEEDKAYQKAKKKRRP